MHTRLESGSWWEGFRGYDPESGQAAAKEEAAGEDGAAAGPTGNEYDLVLVREKRPAVRKKHNLMLN